MVGEFGIDVGDSHGVDIWKVDVSTNEGSGLNVQTTHCSVDNEDATFSAHYSSALS